ncbi:MAG: hypothetical protein F7C07_05485 [Desulfurococcales archaeon]|nr:hypothetical protein [Desulfurococcales archaeon]
MARLGLVVTSDRIYRRKARDENLETLKEGLKTRHDVELEFYYTVPNDPSLIKTIVDEASRSCDIVIVTGGTGVSPRDVTVDALSELARKEVKSIADLLRIKSLDEVGEKAFISRASAFIVRNAIVVAIPGNPGSLRILLGILDKLLRHLTEELKGTTKTHLL